MKSVIVADLAALTPGVRDAVIEFIVRNPSAELAVLSSTPGFSYVQAKALLEKNKIPYDALMVNPVVNGRRVSPLSFKTMMLVAMEDNYDIVLAIDFDPMAIDMYWAKGARLVYNPMNQGELTSQGEEPQNGFQ